MIGGTVGWYAALRANVPMVGMDRERNIALLRTKQGNIVAATQDAKGRIFLFDKAGNIYYDTDDAALGLYIVDPQGDMFNKYLDKEGRVQEAYVGNLSDLTSIKVTEIGGVPIGELQRSIRGFKGGRVVGFPKLPAGKELSLEDLMPPNAPATIDKEKGRIRPPPFLEDREIELEPNGGLFGGPKNVDSLDSVELFKSLRPEAR